MRSCTMLLALLLGAGMACAQTQPPKSLKQSWKELLQSAKELKDAVQGKKPAAAEAPKPGQEAGGRPADATQVPRIAVRLDEFAPESWKHGAMWAPSGGGPLPDVPSGSAGVELPERFDVNDLSQVDVIAAITAAKEAMRLLMGPSSPEQDRAFELRWAPYYEYPARPVLEYLEKLNPLLNEFLAVRAALMQAIAGFEDSWEEAEAAAGAGDEASVIEAMEICGVQRRAIAALQSQLVEIAVRIEELGDMPNPLELKAAARRRHAEATAQVRQAVAAKAPKPAAAAAASYWVLEGVQERATPLGHSGAERVSFAPRHGHVSGVWSLTEGGTTFLVAGEVRWEPPPALLPRQERSRIARIEFPVSAACTRVDLKGVAPGHAFYLMPCGVFQAALGSAAQTTTIQASPAKPADQAAAVYIYEVPPQAERLEFVYEVSAPGGQAAYHYRYKPANLNDDQVAEVKRQEQMQRQQLAAGQAQAAAAHTQAAALTEAKMRAIALHRENQAYFRSRIQDWERQMQGAPLEQREALRWQKMAAEANLASEKDQEQMIETGEWVRTRTAFDDWNLARMVAQGREMAQELEYRQRALSSYVRLVNMLPPGQRQDERKQLEQVLDRSIREGDNGILRRQMTDLHGKIAGHWQREGARAEAAAARADLGLTFAESIKSAADTSLMGLSMMGGGGVLYMAYMGGTGYIEGGPRQVVKHVVASIHPVSMGLMAAYDGYHAEAIDPATGEVRPAGAQGAAYSAGMVAAQVLLMRSVAGPLARWAQKPQGQPPAKWPTVREQLAQAKFDSRMADGRAKVKLFQQRSERLADAMRRNANPREIARLRVDAEEAAKVIKCDYAAKMVLNLNARGGDAATMTRYLTLERQLMAQVEKNFQQRMTKDQWAPQQLRQFSNSASKGKAGMDVDLGLVEPPKHLMRPDGGYVLDTAGKKVFNPEWWQWKRGLTQNGQTRSIYEYQEAGQRNLDAAFRDVFAGRGRKTDEAFVNFTSSANREAYKDLAMLGRERMPHADFERIDRQWLTQSGDVTAFKVNHAPGAMPEALRFQEACRTLVKDMNTKLIGAERGPAGGRDAIHNSSPLARMNPGVQRHVLELRAVMDDFANNRIGPIDAQRRIRELTGGEGITAVADTFQNILVGAQSVPAAPARPAARAPKAAPPKKK